MAFEFSKLESWNPKGCERPFLVAGPCSAETEEQVMETARKLDQMNVSVFRAGIWKPRTRPNGFEGIGENGLSWLKRVKEETGMQVATEVANSKHVELALEYGIDVLWIGARTSANPFAVQEIADSIQGRDTKVMVKNPINPDPGLWSGAIERVANTGITRIAAVHRGFSGYMRTKFRNPPEWQIPVELKRRYPALPMLCDPSHMGGNRGLIAEISQKALDLDYDGLMVESHIDPSNARSDAKQQITPERFGEIIGNLVLRDPRSNHNTGAPTLEELRDKIDGLDNEILDILAQRMEVACRIGEYKKEHNMTVLQLKRWEEVITKNVEAGEKRGLTPSFLEKLFKNIHQESIDHQMGVINKNE